MEGYFASSLHSLLNVGSMLSSVRGMRLFANSDAGEILVYKLMSMKRTTTFGHNSVSFPYEENGALFGVSRTHIRRLMKKAENDGFIRVVKDGGREIEILPPLQNLFESMVAARVARAQFDIHLANRDYDLLPIDKSA